MRAGLELRFFDFFAATFFLRFLLTALGAFLRLDRLLSRLRLWLSSEEEEAERDLLLRFIMPLGTATPPPFLNLLLAMTDYSFAILSLNFLIFSAFSLNFENLSSQSLRYFSISFSASSKCSSLMDFETF